MGETSGGCLKLYKLFGYSVRGNWKDMAEQHGSPFAHKWFKPRKHTFILVSYTSQTMTLIVV